LNRKNNQNLEEVVRQLRFLLL